MSATLLWLRDDLRLTDHPALSAALRRGSAIVPVYIHAPAEAAPWQPGAASNWWLHHSLIALDAALRRLGSRLVVRTGPSLDTLLALIEACGADSVYWSTAQIPALRARDAKIARVLEQRGATCRSFNAALLLTPDQVRKSDGAPFRVFTPFWRTCRRELPLAQPQPAPAALPAVPASLTSLSIEELCLLPRSAWDTGLRESWQPGEEGALAQLTRFTEDAIEGYATQRDLPAISGTSRLSPHLHFGEIGPRQVAWAAHSLAQRHGSAASGAEAYLRELGWREFAHHVLWHFPESATEPMDVRFTQFPWRRRYRNLLTAWQRGLTGIPIVDAGMRELWRTGWMHNRVRMIAASFLTKHCRVPWQEGARWFWDTLVDADLANNSLGWQWVAGCGVDAAPYFRIFNPVRQSERFDPSADYLRRWLPELAELPAPLVHAPWRAPAAALARAGVTLGTTYPAPIVDLETERIAALEAFATIKKPPDRPAKRATG